MQAVTVYHSCIALALTLLAPSLAIASDIVGKDRLQPCCFPDATLSHCHMESSLYGNFDYTSYGDYKNRRGLHVQDGKKSLFDLDALIVYVFTDMGCSIYDIDQGMKSFPCLPKDSELVQRYQIRDKQRKGWKFVNGWRYARAFVDADYNIVPDQESVFTYLVDEETCLPMMYTLEHPGGVKDTAMMNSSTANYEGSDLFDLDLSRCVRENVNAHSEL